MILIRKATPVDAKLIAHLAQKSFIESHGHSASPGDIAVYVSKNLSVEAIRKELYERKNIYHIIFYRGAAAGFSKIILYHPHHSLPFQRVTKLERLYLLAKFHNRSLGRRLLKYLVNLCRQKAQVGMWLFVWTENGRANRFYRQFGFRVAGRADFKISEQHYNPNYLMHLVIH
jgi:ribosomal protein S18 acetylase RimI-like enzyme